MPHERAHAIGELVPIDGDVAMLDPDDQGFVGLGSGILVALALRYQERNGGQPANRRSAQGISATSKGPPLSGPLNRLGWAAAQPAAPTAHNS